MSENIKNNYKKTCLLTAWFISKNITILLNKILGEGVNSVRQVSGFEIEIKVLSIIQELQFFLTNKSVVKNKT
jgi:hypothetical protein